MSAIAALDLGMGHVILIVLVVFLIWGARKLARDSEVLDGLREGCRQFLRAFAQDSSSNRPLDEDEDQRTKFNWWVLLSLVVLVILIIGLVVIQR